MSAKSMHVNNSSKPSNFRLTRLNGVRNKSTVVEFASRGEQCGSYDLHDTVRWYCARTHANEEYTALCSILARGIELYLPLFVREVETCRHSSTRLGIAAGERVEVIDIMFPGYLFVAFDVRDDNWKRIHSARGVQYLFGGERPIPVPPRLVEDLAASGRASDGVIDPHATRPDSGLQRGETGTIASGPLAGHEGICQWRERDRIMLLVQIMGGRQVEVVANANNVTRVA